MKNATLQKQDFEIRRVDAFSPDLHRMIGELDKALSLLYPSEGIFGVDFDSPAVRNMSFVVAYIQDEPVGCGGLRPLDGFCELKRFYVSPLHRRKGIATAMLRYFIEQAKADGFTCMRLETGPKQPDAIALYKRAGFYEIGLYGPYTCSDFSTCFEKMLYD